MVTHDGGTADGVSQKNSNKYEIHIHHHGVSGHSHLPYQAHKLDIIENPYYRCRYIAHQLRGSVNASIPQSFRIEGGRDQAELLLSTPQETGNGEQPTYTVSQHGGKPRSGYPHIKQRNKYIVQHDVGQPGGY